MKKQSDNDYWKISSDYTVVDNRVAMKIGLNEAIVLRTLYSLCRTKKQNQSIEWWQGSREFWLIKFPWLSESTLRRIFDTLTMVGLIEKRVDKKTGNSYKPNPQRIDEMLNDDSFQLAQNEPTGRFKMNHPSAQNEPLMVQNEPLMVQNEPSLLSLGSLSLSPSLSPYVDDGFSPPPSRSKKPDGSFVFEAYREAYERRYRVQPIRNAKVNSICSQIVKQVGVDEGKAVMHFYLQQNVAWYIQKGHAIEYALKDLQALRTNMLNNKSMSSREAQQADKQQAQKNVLDDYLANRDEYQNMFK